MPISNFRDSFEMLRSVVGNLNPSPMVRTDFRSYHCGGVLRKSGQCRKRRSPCVSLIASREINVSNTHTNTQRDQLKTHQDLQDSRLNQLEPIIAADAVHLLRPRSKVCNYLRGPVVPYKMHRRISNRDRFGLRHLSPHQHGVQEASV